MLMWLNQSEVIINAMSQLLNILVADPRIARDNFFQGDLIKYIWGNK